MEDLSQDDYDELINFALDIGNKEWFNELCQKQKTYDENIKCSKEYDFPLYMRALVKLKNNFIYVVTQNDSSIIYPETEEEIEKGRIVKTKALINKKDIGIGEIFQMCFLKKDAEKIAKTILKQTIGVQNKFNNLSQKYKKLEEINELSNDIIKSQEKMIEDYKRMNSKKWWKFWKRR